MIKAEITISTCYGEAVIPVEVLGVGPRPGTAWVQALNGLEPFTKISHGGPFQDSSALVSIPRLRNVCIKTSLAELPREEVATEVPPNETGIAVEDWFLKQIPIDSTQRPEVALYENRIGVE